MGVGLIFSGEGISCRVQGLGLSERGLGSKVSDFTFEPQDLGLGVEGLRSGK